MFKFLLRNISKNRIINDNLVTIEINAKNNTKILYNILDSLNHWELDYQNIESKYSLLNKEIEPSVKFSLTYKNKFDKNKNWETFNEINSILKKNNFNIKKSKKNKVPYFPLNLEELNNSGRNLLDLEGWQTDHISFTDKNYIKRKANIMSNLDGYDLKNPIPNIEYNHYELDTWRSIYSSIKGLMKGNFCDEYLECFQLLEDEKIFSEEFIPQLEDISNFVSKKSGLKIKPVKGIVSQREYFEILAYRYFSSTQYLRHHGDFKYTPEPDLMHELIGHVPMFCNNEYTDISQKLGLLSLGKSDEFIANVGKLYWFTIEFGMLWDEKDKKQIFGGGIISSVGEIENAMKNENLKKFEISDVVKNELNITTLQDFYFYNKSLKELNENLDRFIDSIKKDFYLTINKDNNKISIDRCIEQYKL